VGSIPTARSLIKRKDYINYMESHVSCSFGPIQQPDGSLELSYISRDAIYVFYPNGWKEIDGKIIGNHSRILPLSSSG
jgi:hypothetical protein